MPYRRLPNTDNARIKALKTALETGKEIPPFKLAFRQSTLLKIEYLLPNYLNALSEHKAAYTIQLEKSKKQNLAMKKARLYISHFIQVIQMSVQRGDLTADTKKYFGLEEYDKKLPSLSTEEEILQWSEKLSKGEQKRQMKGYHPIMNPTIAVVKVHCDKFREARNNMNNIKSRLEKSQFIISTRREEVDSLIQSLWNEIEDSFKSLPEELKRKHASEYGVVYVFRKNELKNPLIPEINHLGVG